MNFIFLIIGCVLVGWLAQAKKGRIGAKIAFINFLFALPWFLISRNIADDVVPLQESVPADFDLWVYRIVLLMVGVLPPIAIGMIVVLTLPKPKKAS